uniref:Uncharacterized protein n=1 Tax=Nymphaea colorata TaxID=210225 RepID=A0A5K1CN37_9MAGN
MKRLIFWWDSSEGSRYDTVRNPPVSSVDGMYVPVKRLRFSTLSTSKRTGKLAPSRRTTTRGSSAMNGPGGMFVRKTVDWYRCILDLKKSSFPWNQK